MEEMEAFPFKLLQATAIIAWPLFFKKERVSMATHALIIEDNPDLRYILKARLEHVGYTTSEANDGIEALEQLAKNRPDILLLDLGLPRMNGYAFLEALEQRQPPILSAIIVLTADQEAATKLAHKQVTILLKPYTFDQLLETMRLYT
jgi:two-component system response regulator